MILDEAKAFEGKVDALFLGYAVCNSLENITREFGLPAAMLEGCDCIEAVLGPEEYKAEKKVCTGTWFNTPGWAMEGTAGLIKEMHLDEMEDYGPEFFFDIIFDSYKRALFIDTGIGDEERYKEMSEKFADELKLKHDCRKCDLHRIEQALARTKALVCRRRDRMAKVEVNMRTCQKHHVIEVTMNDEGNLDVKIQSDCPHVREYAEKLTEITLDDVTSFAGSKVVDPDVRASLSVPCLVPNAVFDAAWIETGMLSKNLCNKARSNDIVLDGQE